MQIVEEHIEGKSSDFALCEDFIVKTPSFIAVIDGATDKSGKTYEGMTSGKYIASLVAAVIKELPKDITALEAFRLINVKIKNKIRQEDIQAGDCPAASVALYSRHRQEIWRVGDVHIRIGKDIFPAYKLIDDVNTKIRCLYLELCDLASIDTSTDPGRAIIMPILQKQGLFANNNQSEYGYGVVNGKDIPADFIEVWQVHQKEEIVFASDGYLSAQGDLQSAEEKLAVSLQADPMRRAEFASTKGLIQGQKSFDDRAWIRFFTQ